MRHSNAKNVELMYSSYPYPSPIVGESLIHDVSNLFEFIFNKDMMENKSVLDAGCGTGHRVVQLAKTYNKSIFTGIDLTERSLNLAKDLSKIHHVNNIKFKKENLLNFDSKVVYDIIVSTGVIVALEDPLLGIKNLTHCLSKDGYFLLWLYHPYGEFHRLLQRDLIFSFMDNDEFNLQDGVRIMNDLMFNLSDKKYGSSAAQKKQEDVSQMEINVDAFLHPIVNTYSFSEAFNLLRQSGLDWASIASINNENSSMLVDLPQTADDDLANFCIRNSMFLPSERLLERYHQLNKEEQYKIIELSFKPNGFVVMAGFEDSFLKLDEFNHGNIINL